MYPQPGEIALDTMRYTIDKKYKDKESFRNDSVMSVKVQDK